MDMDGPWEPLLFPLPSLFPSPSSRILFLSQFLFPEVIKPKIGVKTEIWMNNIHLSHGPQQEEVESGIPPCGDGMDSVW